MCVCVCVCVCVQVVSSTQTEWTCDEDVLNKNIVKILRGPAVLNMFCLNFQGSVEVHMVFDIG